MRAIPAVEAEINLNINAVWSGPFLPMGSEYINRESPDKIDTGWSDPSLFT